MILHYHSQNIFTNVRTDATTPLVGNLTFYQFNLILSGTATALSSFIAFVLIFLHATHFSNPAQQLKIIRIIMVIPVYSLYSFFCVVFAQAQVSLLPWQDLVQAFALGNFFLLLLELISPHEDQRSLFFAGIDLPGFADSFSLGGKKKKTPTKPKKPVDALAWYRRKWIAVFQFILVSMVVGIITDVTEATGNFCDTSYNPRFAHLWMTVIINVSESIAITAIILFYQATKTHLATHRPLSKLAAFKGIIFFIFISGIIFDILQGTGALKPTKVLTYADTKVGIPTLVQLLFMIPISCFFHYAYSYQFYVIGGKHSLEANKSDVHGYTPSYQGGPLGIRAYLAALNPTETFSAIIFSFKLYMPSSQDYVRRRMEGPHGAAYAKGSNNSSNNSSSNNMPGFEPLRTGAGPYPNGDYATNDISLAPTQADYNQSFNQPAVGYGSQPGYQNLPNPSIREPEGGMGYAAGVGPLGSSPPSRGHSRSPSREQFLPPVNGRDRGESFGHGQPTAYGPLSDRERY